MKLSARIMASLVPGLLLAALTVNHAQAHLFAPSLLKFVETTHHDYKVLWKTPVKTASDTPLKPTWPDSCRVTTESPPLRRGYWHRIELDFTLRSTRRRRVYRANTGCYRASTKSSFGYGHAEPPRWPPLPECAEHRKAGVFNTTGAEPNSRNDGIPHSRY